jgi:hypothetical protein
MYPDDTNLPSSPPMWLLILIALVGVVVLYGITQL